MASFSYMVDVFSSVANILSDMVKVVDFFSEEECVS